MLSYLFSQNLHKETLFFLYKKKNNSIKNMFRRYKKILEEEKKILLHHIVKFCSDFLDVKMFSLLEKDPKFYIHLGTKHQFLYECIRKKQDVNFITQQFKKFRINLDVENALKNPSAIQTGISSIIENIDFQQFPSCYTICIPTIEAFDIFVCKTYFLHAVDDVIHFCVNSENKNVISYCMTWLNSHYASDHSFDLESNIIQSNNLELIKWYNNSFSFKHLDNPYMLPIVFHKTESKVFSFFFQKISKCKHLQQLLNRKTGNVEETINIKSVRKMLKM